MAFINNLYDLRPDGDEKIPGLRDGTATPAPAVFQKYGIDSPRLAGHVTAQIPTNAAPGMTWSEISITRRELA